MNRSKRVTVGADIEVFVSTWEPPKPPPKSIKRTDSKKGMSAHALAFDEIMNLEAGDVLFTDPDTGETTHAAVPDEQPHTDAPVPEEQVAFIENPKKSYAGYKKMSGLRRKTKRERLIVPCVGLFPGTKAKPYHPNKWPKGYAIQEDNVMLEFNIPATTSPRSLQSTLQMAKTLVTKICESKNLQPQWLIPEWKFKKIELESPQAQLFACDPDMDAYTGGIERVSPPDFGDFRTCGGHIHIGGDFNCPDFVAVLFLELYLAFTFGGDFIYRQDTQRAKWYGRPGIYRTKPYGIEYRTLSNMWIASRYTINDTARIAFMVGNLLVNTPAGTLQQWFRGIEWTELYNAITAKPSTTNEEHNLISEKWNNLRHQVHQLGLPGISI